MTSPRQFGSAQRCSPQPQGKPWARNIPSGILRYSLAVVSVALALLATLVLQRYKFRGVVLSLFLFAIALTVWYVDVGPAIVAIVLSILCFIYFFSPPIYSFAFSVADVPAILILLSFAVLIVRFSAVRRRVEGQLLKSEKELRDIVETMPAMAWSALPDGSNAFVTRQWTEYTGLSAEQSSGSGWQSTVHPDDLASHSEGWCRSLATGQPFERETRLRRAADGQYRWFLIRGTPLRDESGNILKWYGLATDIEDRKRAEEALRSSQAYLSEAQRLSKTGSWAFRPGMAKPVYWSEEMFRIWGFDPRQGLPDNETAWQRIHPEDLEATVRDQIEKAFTGRFEVDVVNEFRIMLPDGTLKYIRGTGHPVFDDMGKVAEYVGTSVDVTEHKHAEEALRRSQAYLAESQRLTKTGSWAYNPFTGKTLYWSDEMFRIFGIDPKAGPSSEKFWRLVHPEDLDRVRERVEMEAHQKTGYVDEYRVVLPDGTLKHILDIGHPLFSGAGDVMEFVGTTVDVTERTRAEQTLRRSEAYLAEAQRLSKTGSWAWSPVTGEPLFWSEEMFRIFGLNPQEGVPATETFLQRIHPEDLDRTYELLKKAALGNMDYEHEHRIVLPDGSFKHIQAIGHPVLDVNGQVAEYVGTAMDVTDRKRAEEALQRSEAYLAEAQRLTHTGSWAWEPTNDKVLYWSEEMFRIFGLDPQEGTPTGAKFGRRIHPEDHDRVYEYVRESVGRKTEYVVYHRIVLPDGTVRHIETIGHPVLDSSGEVVEYVGTAMDTTARRRAEEELHAAETRFRASVDHLADALFIHDDQDDQGRVIDVNQQACDSLGYTREELIGMTAFDYDALADEAVMISIKERLARGEIFSFESAHRRKDGTVFPAEVRVRPFSHGDHRFGLAVVRDITDRKRSEQERERLRQLEADLARLNRVSMMGELAASLAHEIKQPIAAAATNAKTGLRWLQREPPDAGEARDALSRIVDAAKRAADIIERNRSLYQRDTPKRETVNLNEVVREMIALLQDAAYRQSVSIRVELDGDVPATTADRVQMQQVLMNLMLNGIEAMKDTGGELTIRSKKTEDRQILVSVSDVGVGLPGDNADRVFDAFFTTKAQGTGMGLSICRRIIESHDGRLWACANTGRGTTFHFTLPTAPSPSCIPAP